MTMPDFDTLALDIARTVVPVQTTQDRAKLQVAIIEALKTARDAALEEAAVVATDFAGDVKTFGCIPSDPFESMADGARRLAKAIRRLKGGA